MAAKGHLQWDEAALPKPKLPQRSSPDADERRLAWRRYVSGVPRGLLGAVESGEGCLPLRPVPACLCSTC